MKRVKNEKGNASIYLIWMTFILGLMIILVINMADAFLVNQQASIGVEQASIAATDIVFNAVRDAVDEYDDHLKNKFYLTAAVGEIFKVEWTLLHKIKKKEQELIHNGYTENEAAIKAIDTVVTAHLPGDEGKLREYVTAHLNLKKGDIKSVVSSIISSNKGDTTKAKVTLFKEETGSFGFNSSFHIEVSSTKTFEGTEFKSFFPPIQKDMEQIGMGPTIDFAKKLYYPNTTFMVH